jgi:hypothetical protein
MVTAPHSVTSISHPKKLGNKTLKEKVDIYVAQQYHCGVAGWNMDLSMPSSAASLQFILL